MQFRDRKNLNLVYLVWDARIIECKPKVCWNILAWSQMLHFSAIFTSNEYILLAFLSKT